MHISIKSSAAFGCIVAVVMATAACSPRRIPPMTVVELMEDRVTLDGVLMKCNQHQANSGSSTECLNARIAIERLASQHAPAEEAKRAEQFERSREQLRMAQERQRQQQEAKNTKPDAYHLPVIPVEPPASAPSPEPSAGNTNPPIASQPPR